MRIAIISDIHANLEALTTALDHLRNQHIDQTICLGDLVGYGANPNECVELVRSLTDYVLLGNHDEAAVDLEQTIHFNPLASHAIRWTHEQLTEEHVAYLGGLRRTLLFEELLFVHSSPFEPEQWHYIISPADAYENFEYFTEQICFVGHSHVAGVFSEDLWTSKVERGKRFIVNVGSIGQPRDRDPRLSYGIMDTDTWQYTNVRLRYDIDGASGKILKAGLPPQLAERLYHGT